MAEGPGAHEAAESPPPPSWLRADARSRSRAAAGALVRALQRTRREVQDSNRPTVHPGAKQRLVIDYLAAYGISVVSSVSLEVADNVMVGRVDQGRSWSRQRGPFGAR